MASNLRVLVSNLGDGNWTPVYTGEPPVAQDSSPNMLTEDAAHDVVFFPPGSSKGTAPTVAQQIGASVDTIGWGSKTNWLFQLHNTVLTTGAAASADVSIFGYRPTGVPELIKAVPKADLENEEIYTWGGAGGEEVYGPFIAFKFELSNETGSPKILCYVTGWNDGDICDNQIEIT